MKYHFTKNEEKKTDLLRNLTDNVLDSGSIGGGETISYSLRLWIDSSVEDESRIQERSLSYRIEVEVTQPKKHAITFNADGGDMEETETIINSSASEELPIPTRRGYTFDGWYTEQEGGEKVENSKEITEDGILYARWSKGKFKVSFNATGGNVNNSTKEVTYTENYGELPTPTRTNYKFLGWYTDENDGEKIEDITTVTITENQTLYAHWEKHILLSTLKQGDYVAYVGNNGCRNNGVDTTGTGEAESKNSCLGWNANQTSADTTTFGYCYNSSYKFSVTGWRIAYIENNQAYLISAGSPECNAKTSSTANAAYINLANTKAKKYCNPKFADGNCSNNDDSWAISNSDFYKITSAMNNGAGRHLNSYYGSNHCYQTNSVACGKNNNLIDNGGYYWFAAAFNASSTDGIDWDVLGPFVNYHWYSYAFGLRPIIRLSSSVYVTEGKGTMSEPYTIAND